MDPARRADEVADLPHVKTWIKRFRKLVEETPPEVWVYVASGVPHVMALDPNGRPYEKGDAMDSQASITSIRGRGQWDGGDW